MAIESRIEGASTGWNGNTIVQLVNGQIWRQSEYYYRYRYRYRPHVRLVRNGGYRMKIEGIDRAVKVERLK